MLYVVFIFVILYFYNNYGLTSERSKVTAISGQTLRVSVGWGSKISRQSAHESGKIVSPKLRPLLPTRKYSWYNLC